jgi:hypothetical protein
MAMGRAINGGSTVQKLLNQLIGIQLFEELPTVLEPVCSSPSS